MSGGFPSRVVPSPPRPSPAQRRGEWGILLLSAALAVCVLAVGLRLLLDAAPLAARFWPGQPAATGDVAAGPTVIRLSGVATLAAGQWIVLSGVVRRWSVAGRWNRPLSMALLVVAAAAMLAAGVLYLSARQP